MRTTAAFRSRAVAAIAVAFALTTAQLAAVGPASARPATASPAAATAGVARGSVVTLPAVPSAAESAHAAKNLKLLNKARAAKGLRALTLHPSLAASALMWSSTMAATGNFTHNPWGFGEAMPLGWRGMGENIAWAGWSAGDMGSWAHDAWMDSPGHRANILGDYTHVGIGIFTAPDGSTYATQVFAELDADDVPTPTLTGFGGTAAAPAGATVDVTVTSGAAGVLERLTDTGWQPVRAAGANVAVPAGRSVVRVPAPTKSGRTTVFRISVAATATTTPTWSPALAVTARAPKPRLSSSTWPKAARSVTLGKRVTTTATVRAGAWVLERRNPGSSTWTKVRSGNASRTTKLTLSLKPSKPGTTTFRLRLPATATTTASALTLKVTARRTSVAKVTATKVSARPGRTAAVTVRVSSKGRLETYAKGRWRTVRSVTAGTTKVRLTAGKAGTTTRYRVVVPRTTTVTGATSKVIKVVARR